MNAAVSKKALLLLKTLNNSQDRIISLIASLTGQDESIVRSKLKSNKDIAQILSSILVEIKKNKSMVHWSHNKDMDCDLDKHHDAYKLVSKGVYDNKRNKLFGTKQMVYELIKIISADKVYRAEIKSMSESASKATFKPAKLSTISASVNALMKSKRVEVSIKQASNENARNT